MRKGTFQQSHLPVDLVFVFVQTQSRFVEGISGGVIERRVRQGQVIDGRIIAIRVIIFAIAHEDQIHRHAEGLVVLFRFLFGVLQLLDLALRLGQLLISLVLEGGAFLLVSAHPCLLLALGIAVIGRLTPGTDLKQITGTAGLTVLGIAAQAHHRFAVLLWRGRHGIPRWFGLVWFGYCPETKKKSCRVLSESFCRKQRMRGRSASSSWFCSRRRCSDLLDLYGRR